MALLEVVHLKKTYTTRFGGAKVQALTDVSFAVEEGEFVAIMGESGSGKTTLLNILASLDKPTGGEVILKGTPMSSIKESKQAAFRRERLGFIFQDFNLLDTFNVEDNIYLPMVLSGRQLGEMRSRLTPLAETLGISDILKKFPYEISGGQKQRVAAARALITRPDIVLADEPTGALDSKASSALLRLLAQINKDGQTILMVTHSARAASKSGRALFIRDGEVFHQIYRGSADDKEMYQKISDTLTVSAGKAGA
jgi:putative ABC transport system ATP-binding protein